jgi:hypothetical protein
MGVFQQPANVFIIIGGRIDKENRAPTFTLNECNFLMSERKLGNVLLKETLNMEPQVPICQSCGMPMEGSEVFGTRADGRRSNDYCRFCLDKGKFTDPTISMEQMIEKITSMAPQMKMSESEAREMARRLIPKLKRWQRK